MGADFVATGHYARVDLDPATGRYRLKRGADPAKDQSYFLFTLDQAQLAHAMFPVGDLDKTAVREQARELGLDVADKPDSHEICFVADGDHAAFLERAGAMAGAGAIRDAAGHSRRQTRGRASLHRRPAQGPRTLLPDPALRRRYRRRREQRSIVGPKDALERTELTASGVNWIAGAAPEQVCA